MLSQVEVTGAETYVATLVAEQAKAGHEVIAVSDTLATAMPAEHVPMPIARRDFPHRLRNVLALRRLIHARRVHVVNAHSRAASWVAFFATRASGVPLVSTIHSRQWLPPQSRWYSVYGERIVAVSESLLEHARSDLGIPPERSVLVRNALDLERFSPRADGAGVRARLGLDGRPVVALVSRLSRVKAEIAKFFVAEVLERVRAAAGDAVLLVVGGQEIPAGFAELVAETNARLGGGAIHLAGHQPEVAAWLAAADVVVGSGSVAMEAMAVARPVVALGESAYLGVVTEAGIAEARACFFGDHTEPRPRDAARIAADVAALLRDPGRRAQLGRWGRSFVERQYAAGAVARQVEGAYRQARLELLGRRGIPVLMYHKVVTRPVVGSRHGTWVTREAFARQLRSLRRRGMTTVTLRDVAAASRGERALPRRPVVLTFDDGYVDNHTNAWPLLARHGMTAVVFVVADPALNTNAWDAAAGEPQAALMSRDQVRELAAHGIEIGSHTATHPRLPELSGERLRDELEGSRRAIEAWLGRPVASLAYPYGAVSEHVKTAARDAGYEMAVATNSGPVRFGADPLEIRRVHILPWSGRFAFWKRSSRWYFRYKLVEGNLPRTEAPQ